MKHNTVKELTLQALTKFPKAPSKTIAEYLVKRFPQAFANVESARSSVRRYRGAQGDAKRKFASKEHIREPQPAGAGTFAELPEGLTSFEDWGSKIIEGPARALLLSDIHVPYHDKAALEAAVEYGKDANLIILNGDVLDCYEVSRFEPDPRKCDFAGALKTAQELFTWLRTKFPSARIIYKEGNHSERLERYFITRAPAVLGCEEFRLPNLLKLGAFGIEWLGEKRPIKLGKLHVIHGHEFRAVSPVTVNPARSLFLRAKVHAIQGHNHQSSQHSERSLAGKVISTWSTGCLCDLHPEYMPLNNWVHGGAIIDVDARGTFEVENFRIIEGKLY